MLKRARDLLLSSRDFAFLMLVQFLAQLGDGLVQGALTKYLVFGGQEGFDPEAAPPQELLNIALYIFVPYMIISPFLGVVIDRWDRRRLLFVANALRGVLVALVAIAGVDDVPKVFLFGVFLLTLASTRVVLATKSAAMPAVLARDDLVEANALSQLGGAMFQLGGAGIAFVGARFIRPEPIALLGGAVYLGAGLVALAIRRAGEPRERLRLAEEVAAIIGRITAGIAEVARKPKAGASITTYFWIRLLWSFSLVGIGFVTRELLAQSDVQVLLVTGAAGAAGAVAGFIGARKLLDRVRSTASLVLGASALAGVAVAILGSLRLQLALALLAFLLGLGFFLSKISLDTMVQEALGDDFRGRAFSLYDIAYNLAWVVAGAVMKVLWDESTAGALISGMGIVFLIGLAGIGAWFRRAGLLRPLADVGSSRG